MDLGNPFKVIVHYLLTKRMIDPAHWDRIPMVSRLACMVIHYIGHMVSNDISYRVVTVSPSYNTICTLNIEKILNLC